MTGLRPDCPHRWILYAPALRRWWQPARTFWRRREWLLACPRCGGSASFPTKAEAIAHMTSDDWGRP